VGDPAPLLRACRPARRGSSTSGRRNIFRCSGEHPVKEWTKGTWLKPLLDALEEPERSGFEAAYAALVGRAYPRRADGRTLMPFRRLFIVAKARHG
jgi:trans-aconitate methyltransferase